MCGASNNAGLHAFFYVKDKINFKYEAHINLLYQVNIMELSNNNNGKPNAYTSYQTKYFAWELSRKRNASDEDKFTSVLSEAKVDLNPHQIEAALFAFRSPLSKGAILADEVGLGKTIEAALVISQHWAERKRHILIISPATLRKQWSVELEDKFYIPSLILEKKLFNKILNDTYKNPFDNTDSVIICSYPFARKNIDHINRVNWDLVVIDEAHALRNVYKSNNKTGLALKNGLQDFKKLLLTATPLQNDIKELYGMISIIDNDYFGNLPSFSAQYNKVALRNEETYLDLRRRILPIVHRTLRSQVQAYVKYTNRIPLVQEYFPTAKELELSVRINKYLEKTDSFGLPNSQRNLISLILYKLLASSTLAIAGTLESIILRLENLITNNNANIGEDLASNYEEYDNYQDEWMDEESEDDNAIVEKKVLTPQDIEEIKLEINELKDIHKLALSISSNSKGTCLLNALRLGFEHMDSMNASRKALIFTESRRTQEYLYNLLEENGYSGKIVLFNGSNNDIKSKEIYNEWLEKYKNTSRVTGSKTADKRQALVEYFKDNAQIMIATEAAAEGINLQFCSVIVNYDLPWNPQRVEQRIGRCHRYGQKYDVVVVNFINKSNRADQRVYELLDQKFNLFKGVFGASDEVLGSIGNGVDFEKRILAIYQQCRTTEDIDRAFDNLQEELRDDIESSLQQTKVSLFENFDEEVIEKLKIRESKDTSLLNKHSQLLWKLTCGVLGSDIIVNSNDKYEFVLYHSPISGIPVGLYNFDKDNSKGYNYRISHPLAQWVVNKAKQSETSAAVVEFDYSCNDAIISILKQNVGNTGYLTFRVVRYNSLNEVEEHILLAATDKYGNKMERDFAVRLLSLPAKIVSYQDSLTIEKLSDIIETEQDNLLEWLEVRNSDMITSEITKVENWAEDNRKALQQKLTELDKAIDEKNSEFVSERNIRKKLAIQKEKDALNDKRDAAWREYDQKREELKKDKNKIISHLYELADGNMEIVDEYTIKWIII